MIPIIQVLTFWRSIFSKLFSKQEMTQSEINYAIVLLFTISIFLPYFFSIAAVACIAFMTMVRYHVRTKALDAPYTKLIFVFLIGSFFVAAIYNNYRGMMDSLLIYAVVTSGLYFRSIMTRDLFDFSMDSACAASVGCAIVAIIQKILAYTIFKTPSYRPTSDFVNANFYGMMIEFVILIAVYRIFTNPRKISFYGAVIGFNFVGLYLTASCSSFVAMVCAVSVILIYKKDKKIARKFFGVIAVCFALFFVFPALMPRSADALETTLAQRLSIWSTSWKAFRQTPVFGRGAMAYQIVWQQFDGYKTYHCHNLVLDTLLNFGVVGLLAVGGYIWAQLHLTVLKFRYHICRDMDVLAFAALTAVLVHGFTDVTILWIQTGSLFFLMVSSIGIDSAYLSERMRPRLYFKGTRKSPAQAMYLKN